MFLPFFFLSRKRLPTADSGGESFLFFLSESKSKRLPTADCGGESFLFFLSESKSQLRYKMEQVRCYGCSNLLILASLEERRAYKRDCCGISFHHNCVRQEFLTSKCVSCNMYTDGLLLKTVPFRDLVVIEEERSELAPSKILCVICVESESVRNKLLVTRCCRQFAHIYGL